MEVGICVSACSFKPDSYLSSYEFEHVAYVFIFFGSLQFSALLCIRRSGYAPTFPTQSLRSRLDAVRRYLFSTKDLKLIRRTDVLCLGMHFM